MTNTPETIDPTPTRIDESWIRGLPKAEVHVHLEGSFDLIDLLELAEAAGEPLPGPASTLLDVSTHSATPGDTGLSAFLEFLDWQCGLVRTTEQAQRHAYRFAARQSASGIRYTDAIVNPTHWTAWAGRVPDLLASFADGFDRASADGLADVRLCVSLLRQQTADEALALVRFLIEARPRRVVALSIDGDERSAGRVSERFAEAFTLARDAGFRRTVHAGESSGPDGVWDALRLLHAERIDHGVRSIEDPELVAHLARTGVSLGICPRSNVALGVYPSWQEHPLLALRAAGVAVTINTDDPAPLSTTLEVDWAVCASEYRLGEDDLRGFALASVEASFAPEDTKAALRREIADYPSAH